MPDINLNGVVTCEPTGDDSWDVILWNAEGEGHVVEVLSEFSEANRLASIMREYIGTWLNA